MFLERQTAIVCETKTMASPTNCKFKCYRINLTLTIIQSTRIILYL
jgi:hypothetical protein